MAVALNLFRYLFCRAVAGTSGVGGQSARGDPKGCCCGRGGRIGVFLALVNGGAATITTAASEAASVAAVSGLSAFCGAGGGAIALLFQANFGASPSSVSRTTLLPPPLAALRRAIRSLTVTDAAGWPAFGPDCTLRYVSFLRALSSAVRMDLDAVFCVGLSKSMTCCPLLDWRSRAATGMIAAPPAWSAASVRRLFPALPPALLRCFLPVLDV